MAVGAAALVCVVAWRKGRRKQEVALTGRHSQPPSPQSAPHPVMSGLSICYLSSLLPVLVLLLLGSECCLQPATGDGDRDVLLAVKKSWGSPLQLKSWDPATNHCRWHGVTCTDGGVGVVTELSLPSLDLGGSVPTSVCVLKSLTHLDLSYNNLTGAFPSTELYACERLTYLDLSNNFFSGPLPVDIDFLSPVMEHLNLSTNRFSGEVPPAVARLPTLKSLLLDTNLFTSAYPRAEISQLIGLERLTLASNAFTSAPVPMEFAMLTNLSYLSMSEMNLIGEIPEEFSSLTELTVLAMSRNNLTGSVPAWVLQHRKLSMLYLFDNKLSGPLPHNVTAMNLVKLELSSNYLTGKIPKMFGNLKNLQLLFLHNNQLTGTIPTSIGLLPLLYDIRLFTNQLCGELPPELGKHSLLSNLEVSNNNLSGPLRESLCFNRKLYNIVVFNNSFSGQLPTNLGDCILLDNLMLYNNHFSADFPVKIWSFPKLTKVMIQNNNFTGTLPTKISFSITHIDMGYNMFSGSVPTSATGLHVFKAEKNQLTGELPADMSKLINLTDFLVRGNMITGSIPVSIKLLHKLNRLDLSDNRLSGAIPSGSIGQLPVVTMLDLSKNDLTGEIPLDINNVFIFLNMSSNQLTGEVPGPLQTAAYNCSFLDNHGLCARANSGTNLPTCPGNQGTHEEMLKGLVIVFLMLADIFLIGIAWLLFRPQKDIHEVVDWKMTSFTHLNFIESDILNNLHEENVIGSGGFGKVYCINLATRGRDEEGSGMVAVKRIWNTNTGKLDEEFDAEVKVLDNINHNNIVKLLCCISSQEGKLLIFEYMENKSLDRWLHHCDREGALAPLDWSTRLTIAIDAAKGLNYMHHECLQPIVHRDVKSSNILLNSNFHAKIADFGLARILVNSDEPQSVSVIGGTFGYMAPEYGYQRKVNAKVDVYSFGVVLLELTTGKVANDSGADLCLAEWAWERYQKGAPFEDVVDEAIREPAYMKNILSVFTLGGVICTGKNPTTRPSMKMVLQHLTWCNRTSVGAQACQMSYECGGTPLEAQACQMGYEVGSTSVLRGRWDDGDEDDDSFREVG